MLWCDFYLNQNASGSSSVGMRRHWDVIRYQCKFRRNQDTQGHLVIPRKALRSNLCSQQLPYGPVIGHFREHSQPFSTTASRYTTKCWPSMCETASRWLWFPHSPLAHSSGYQGYQGTWPSNAQNSICKKLERLLLNHTHPVPLGSATLLK